jgi:hypothetical protein
MTREEAHSDNLLKAWLCRLNSTARECNKLFDWEKVNGTTGTDGYQEK